MLNFLFRTERVRISPGGRLIQNNGRVWFVAAGSEGHRRGQNEAAAEPCERSQVLAQEPDAEPGAEGGFNVEEYSGPRSGNVVDAPVPKQRRCCRTQHSADRSEEHTSELQSLRHLVCRLLLE